MTKGLRFSNFKRRKKLGSFNHFSNAGDATKTIKNIESMQIYKNSMRRSLKPPYHFYCRFGVAPNFVINGKITTIPMAIEGVLL